MKLSEIKNALKANIIVGEDSQEMDVTYGAASDLMSDLLRVPTQGVILLTGLNNIQVIRSSVIAGVSAVVLVRGKTANGDMVDHAKEHNLPLMSTPFTMFTACGRLFREGLRGVDVKAPD